MKLQSDLKVKISTLDNFIFKTSKNCLQEDSSDFLANKNNNNVQDSNIDTVNANNIYIQQTDRNEIDGVYITDNNLTYCINLDLNIIDYSQYKPDIDIPLPGQYGFGCAVFDQAAKSVYLMPCENNRDPKSPTFGNYKDTLDNIFVCVPAFYYKEIGDKVTISFEKTVDSKIPYAFRREDGTYSPCVFVAKYKTGSGFRLCEVSLLNFLGYSEMNYIGYPLDGLPLKPTSLKNAHPVLISSSDIVSKLSNVDMSSISAGTLLFGSDSYDNSKIFAARSEADSRLHYAPLRFVYDLISKSHSQEVRELKEPPKDLCGYAFYGLDKPVGCDTKNFKSSALNDIKFELTDVKEGGGSVIAPVEPKTRKFVVNEGCSEPEVTSHNGQLCGIQDLYGSYYEYDDGYKIDEDGTLHISKGNDSSEYIDSRFSIKDIINNKNDNLSKMIAQQFCLDTPAVINPEKDLNTVDVILYGASAEGDGDYNHRINLSQDSKTFDKEFVGFRMCAFPSRERTDEYYKELASKE